MAFRTEKIHFLILMDKRKILRQNPGFTDDFFIFSKEKVFNVCNVSHDLLTQNFWQTNTFGETVILQTFLFFPKTYFVRFYKKVIVKKMSVPSHFDIFSFSILNYRFNIMG